MEWLAQQGEPKGEVGQYGDLYLDTLTGYVYEKRPSEGWLSYGRLWVPPQ